MTLQNYLENRYSVVGEQLGWTSTDYALMVADVLTLLDIDLESDEANTWKLQRLGEYYLWKRALADVSLDINFSADGSSYSRSNMHTQIKSNLMDAERDCYGWLPVSDATVESITGTDPYGYYESRDGL